MSKAARALFLLALCLLCAVETCAGAFITRMSDKHLVSLAQLVSDASHSDLVLIGEAHDNVTNHEIQLSLIQALFAKKVPLAIGLEMIQSDSQQQLDLWTDGLMSEKDFKAVYARNWSQDWALYRAIFLFARDNQIPMVALNIPKELVSKVSHSGFDSLTPEERKDLPQGTTCDLNNPHTALLKRSFQEVFKHAANGGVFTYFCEAQTLRNSGMAMNVERFVKKHPGRKVVALAGIWHAVKNAIPEQLERKGSKLTNTVILPELPELNTKSADSDLVDYMIGW